ncbi:MAG TPA: DUF2959 family protein [Planctomycetota bacterium]
MLASPFRTLALALTLVLVPACSSTGSAFLVFGGSDAPQADLVARVRASEKELERSRTDFGQAFTLYQRLSAPQAVELERLSKEFASAVKACAGRAREHGKRVDAVREAKEELMQGWSEELAGYSSETMRKKSATMMQDTDTRAQKVLASLEGVQQRMQPVLLKLQDYELFFHHNLNARAIATLEDTYRDFDAEFRALEKEFERARGEVTGFLATFAEKEAEAAPQPAKPK